MVFMENAERRAVLRRTIIFSRIPNQPGLRPEPDSSQPLRDTYWLDTVSTSFRCMEEPEVTNPTSAQLAGTFGSDGVPEYGSRTILKAMFS